MNPVKLDGRLLVGELEGLTVCFVFSTVANLFFLTKCRGKDNPMALLILLISQFSLSVGGIE